MIPTTKIFPDDKIRVILNSASESDPDVELSTDKLHTTIYEAKNEYPILFEEFSFSMNGTFPYSPLLERVLMRGLISRSLSSDYHFRGESQLFIKKVLYPKFNKEDLFILLKIGKRLR